MYVSSCAPPGAALLCGSRRAQGHGILPCANFSAIVAPPCSEVLSDAFGLLSAVCCLPGVLVCHVPPEALMALYSSLILSALKSAAFGKSGELGPDHRMDALLRVLTFPPHLLTCYFCPPLYDLSPALFKQSHQILVPSTHLSLYPTGVFGLDAPDSVVVWVGSTVDPALLSSVFAAPRSIWLEFAVLMSLHAVFWEPCACTLHCYGADLDLHNVFLISINFSDLQPGGCLCIWCWGSATSPRFHDLLPTA